MSQNKTIQGIIKITAKPIGFVTPEGEESKDKDIIVFEEDLNTALNRDRVEIEIIGKESGRRGAPDKPKGKVVKVLERAKTEFVGTLTKSKESEGELVLLTDDFKFYRPIDIEPASAKNFIEAKDGFKALAELTEWKDAKKNPKGKIIQIKGFFSFITS